MLNSGNKFRTLRDKKNYILTLVLSEKKFLNKKKNHNPPPSPCKLNGRSLIRSHKSKKDRQHKRTSNYLLNITQKTLRNKLCKINHGNCLIYIVNGSYLLLQNPGTPQCLVRKTVWVHFFFMLTAALYSFIIVINENSSKVISLFLHRIIQINIRFCIKFPKNKITSERHRLILLSLYRDLARILRPLVTFADIFFFKLWTSGTLSVNLVTKTVISHEWGKDREVFATSETYPWSLWQRYSISSTMSWWRP